MSNKLISSRCGIIAIPEVLVRRTGQFNPMPGSQPTIGKQNQLESIQEYRLELICPADKIHKAIGELKQAHPYEEPAFDILKLVSPEELI